MVEVTSAGLVVARNRKARHDYAVEDTFEAGIVLAGSEVKSLRGGRANIADSHAIEQDGEIWLINAHIPEYASARHFGHESRRPRKLLLHRRQVARLIGAVRREGKTLVPLSIYFNARGRAKVELALAHGKKAHDKRSSIKEREWQRDRQRLMKARG
ncbi:MAG: SsrA-binding protein SmpB [Alphaproteobacteria bacterium]|nr:SsrA-binding protein SmpB [Alphaproteobacteria bacterium]